MTRIIGITMGDPGGIGPEIIAQALLKKQAADQNLAIYGSACVFEEVRKKIVPRFSFQTIRNISEINLKRKIHLIDVAPGAGFDKARVSRHNAELAFRALKTAARDANDKKIQAIVTAPVNKTTMKLFDDHFQGHTEYLAQSSEVSEFAMMFVGDRLKVTLVTIHVPLSKVSELIRKDLVLEKIQLTDQFLKTRMKIKNPRLAVCALNPHGKETGTEEEREIQPAVLEAQKKGANVQGPFSADQLFYDAYEGRFDALIAMYHDQALGPFKMIAFKTGVNVTLGLPFIRTSPDHGTAFDIAWKGKADPESFESALKLAEQLINPKS